MDKKIKSRIVRVAKALEKLSYGEGKTDKERSDKEQSFGKASLHLLPKDLRKKIGKRWLESIPFMGRQGILLKNNVDPEVIQKIYDFWKEWR